MASIYSFILLIWSFVLFFFLVLGVNHDEWLLPINRYMLHELVINSCPDRNMQVFDQTIGESVITKILTEHDLTQSDANFPSAATQVLKTVQSMLRQSASRSRYETTEVKFSYW